jgi:predicted signal transduction protein with EAL and GGDEF domain
LVTLRAMGCHVGQGFFLARPAPAAAIDVLLAAGMPLPHVGLFHVIDEPQLDFAGYAS